MSSPTLWVNKKNLIHNYRLIKSKTKSNFICPMVKANSYGVGDTIVVGELLEVGVKEFGVARLFEAEKLRRTFPNYNFDILIFHPMSREEISSYISNEFTPVVSSFADLEVLKTLQGAELNKIKPIHIKFDLGMSRFGFSIDEITDLKESLRMMGYPIGGVCGHFPNSEDFGVSEGSSKASMQSLLEIANVLGVPEEKVHAPNTAAIERGEFNLGLRPGIGLYGVSSFKGSGFKGVLSLTAPIIGLNQIKKGASVSYGGTWKAEEDCDLAVLPVGYADGLRRGLSSRIKFNNKAKSYQQVGSICMDYTMVNLKQGSGLKIGDELTLFDENFVNLYEWSELLDTIPYEILTGLGDRIDRKVF